MSNCANEQISIELAGLCFTTSDEQKRFINTRAALERVATPALQREYLSMLRESMGGIFRNNAETFRVLIAEELLSRGVNSIPNIFGPIAIETYRK